MASDHSYQIFTFRLWNKVVQEEGKKEEREEVSFVIILRATRLLQQGVPFDLLSWIHALPTNKRKSTLVEARTRTLRAKRSAQQQVNESLNLWRFWPLQYEKNHEKIKKCMYYWFYLNSWAALCKYRNPFIISNRFYYFQFDRS